MKAFWIVSGLVLVNWAPAAALADEVSFRRDIAPILLDRCLACHGPKKAEGGYRVDSFQRLMQEGDTGELPFSGEGLDASEAFRRVVSDDEFERMPQESDALPEEQVELLQRWIEAGARFDGTDPDAELVTIIPARKHPEPPPQYTFAIPVAALEFGHDGQELYAAGYHEVTVWDPSNGELLRRIQNVGQRTYALSLHPDGTRLAVGCGAPGRLGETRLFDARSGELLQVLGSTSDVVLDVAFSRDGERLAVASADGVIRIFGTSSGQLEQTITSHSDWVNALAWDQDDSRLASASRDKTAKVFDVTTGELLVTYSGHGEPVEGVAFHPNGEEVYSSGVDKKLHRWKIADGKKASTVGFAGQVFKLTVDEDRLFASSADRSVRQFEIANNKQLHSYDGHQDWALSVAVDRASGQLASGSFDGRVIVWNVNNQTEISQFYAAPGYSK